MASKGTLNSQQFIATGKSNQGGEDMPPQSTRSATAHKTHKVNTKVWPGVTPNSGVRSPT